MQPPLALNAYRDDLARIVQTVFQTMMDVDVQTAESPWVRPPNTISAAVQFVGEWRGAALVECAGEQACHFAARFLGMPAPAAVDDDVRDVIGELANMVAGNLKSLLPRGVDLSMPCVHEASQCSLPARSVGAVEHLPFSSTLGPFRVTLLQLLSPR